MRSLNHRLRLLSDYEKGANGVVIRLPDFHINNFVNSITEAVAVASSVQGLRPLAPLIVEVPQWHLILFTMNFLFPRDSKLRNT